MKKNKPLLPPKVPGVTSETIASEMKPSAFVLTPAQEAEFERQLAQAEEDLAPARVDFRWGKAQLETIRAAAKIIGVPYQTWMKTTLYERALEILAREQHLHRLG